MKVIVCGSREWVNMAPIVQRIKQLPQLTTIIEGGCDGADMLARAAAKILGHDVIEYPANWNGRGKAAGPHRNIEMLALEPDLLIAFHEDLEKSRGTKHIVGEAKARGIPVEIITR